MNQLADFRFYGTVLKVEIIFIVNGKNQFIIFDRSDRAFRVFNDFLSKEYPSEEYLMEEQTETIIRFTGVKK